MTRGGKYSTSQQHKSRSLRSKKVLRSFVHCHKLLEPTNFNWCNRWMVKVDVNKQKKEANSRFGIWSSSFSPLSSSSLYVGGGSASDDWPWRFMRKNREGERGKQILWVSKMLFLLILLSIVNYFSSSHDGLPNDLEWNEREASRLEF